MSRESASPRQPGRPVARRRPSEVDGSAATAEQIDLMRQLVDARIPAPEFAKAWLAARRRALDEGDRLRDEFDRILIEVFYQLDDYVIDPTLREAGDLTDEGLARRVRNALNGLDSL
jgi:hypothetical protein